MSATTEQQPAAGADQAKGGFWDEMASLKTPAHKDIQPIPKIGAAAPKSEKIPLDDGKPTIVVFLRHCGCPFAEKAFKQLTAVSDKHKEVHCYAVSHSSIDHTEKWVPQVGGNWAVDVVVDEERDLYAQWGLGVASVWHVFNPWVISSLLKVGKEEGIYNKPTESGNRWQTSGIFAVDAKGVVQLAHISKAADDIGDITAALKAVGIEA